MDPAALDGGASHVRSDGLAQPQVGIGDDQLHPNQPTGLYAAQERGPEGPVLAVADGEASDALRPRLLLPPAPAPGWTDHFKTV